MSITLRHTTPRYYVAVIKNDGKGAVTSVVSVEVVALIIWFLGNTSAQIVAMGIARGFVWVATWPSALSPVGWREDLEIIWLAFQMMLRGEFA